MQLLRPVPQQLRSLNLLAGISILSEKKDKSTEENESPVRQKCVFLLHMWAGQ